MMYSAHDNTIANVWAWLKPANFKWNQIPYASYVQINLWYNPQCSTREELEESCFKVSLTSNGKPLLFQIGDRAIGPNLMSYSQFMKYMKSLSY